MTIQVTAGWWLLPLAITVIAFVWAMRTSTDDLRTFGSGALFNLVVWLSAIVPCLLAWLIWAVLT